MISSVNCCHNDSATRYTKNGVIPIDNTLIDHDGKLIEDAGWFWDHADQRHLIAHDYLIANYVCASGKHYPLEFRRFGKKETCVADGTPFKNHTRLCTDLVDWVVAQAIPGDFSFDSYFTNAEILNHINRHSRNYVGDLKFNRTITVDGKDWKASDWVKAALGPLCRRKTTVDGKEHQSLPATLKKAIVERADRLVAEYQENEPQQRQIRAAIDSLTTKARSVLAVLTDPNLDPARWKEPAVFAAFHRALVLLVKNAVVREVSTGSAFCVQLTLTTDPIAEPQNGSVVNLASTRARASVDSRLIITETITVKK